MNKKLQKEIRKIGNKYDIKIRFYNKKLTKESRTEFSDKVDWNHISCYQKLSEGFVREFCDKVNWYGISRNKKLSEGFIMEFYDKLNIDNLLANNNINNKIKEKIKLLQRTIQS